MSAATTLGVEVLAPHELGHGERLLWAQFAAADPGCSSPYFDLRYVAVAAECAQHGAVAVLHRRGQIEGFLPFQRRGRRLQPLGAPLTDYHGLVARPGATFPLAELLKALKAESLRFGGWTTRAGAPETGTVLRTPLAADVSAGFEAYMAGRMVMHSRFFKDKARAERAMARDLGPVQFAFGRADPAVLDWIIARKRAQYARTGRHDIFACGWTGRLLHRLIETAEPDFGARLAVLRAGDRLIAAEYSLVSGKVCHLWFPAYERDCARYAPGMLTSMHGLRAFAEAGGERVDLGLAGEPYKAYFAEPFGRALEGAASARPTARPVAQGGGAALQTCAPPGSAGCGGSRWWPPARPPRGAGPEGPPRP